MNQDDTPQTEYVRYCFYEECEIDGRFVATYALEDVDEIMLRINT